MPRIISEHIEIEYDTFGDDAAPPLLLITGLGGQMILWERDFCEKLANNGLYIIRFDNRDSGLSTKFEQHGEGDIDDKIEAVLRGEKITGHYTLDNMAMDTIELLDGLDIEKAHICGASMGGMIAQIIAIRYPHRVGSLISISSTTSDSSVSADASSGDAKTLSALPLAVPREREHNIEYTLEGFRALSGPGFEFDASKARAMAEALYDRSFYPDGAKRQLLAILLAKNRKPELSKLSVPTLVIHGDSDPLIPLVFGIDTFQAIENARMLTIEGMGHDLPRQAWQRIIDAIVDHIKRPQPLYS